MEESTPQGQHMTFDTFRRALDMTRRVERLAWEMGAPPMILISGGECTEHPEVVRFVEEVVAQRLWPLLITNGMWLDDPELRAALLRPEWPHIRFQVTNDPRFYPRPAPQVDDERITYVPELSLLVTLGRTGRKKDLAAKGLPFRKAPSSFNLRSLVHAYKSIEKAVAMLRMRALAGQSGHCTPSVSDNGDIVAGETRLCWKFGDVDSTNQQMTEALLSMGECNRCGLEDGLTQEQKRAIGTAKLYLGTEP